MIVQEYDPEKRYFVILEDEQTTLDDLNEVSEKLKALNVDAVVLAGATVRGGERYWGIWHEWVGADGKENQNWYVDTTGRVYYYPSEAVAKGAADYFKNLGPGFAQGNFDAREFT